MRRRMHVYVLFCVFHCALMRVGGKGTGCVLGSGGCGSCWAGWGGLVSAGWVLGRGVVFIVYFRRRLRPSFFGACARGVCGVVPAWVRGGVRLVRCRLWCVH